MTRFDPADYADLQPDPWELLQVEEALAETEAEEQAGLPYGDDPGAGGYAGADPEDEDAGPWHDQLEEAGSALDALRGGEADRVVADITDQLSRRPSGEAILARALQRIGDGNYLPAPSLRGDPAARDVSGRYAASCEGVVDDLGACASRFHQPGCGSVIAGAAATGSFESAEAWVDTLRHRTMDPGALGLANDQPDSADGPRYPLGIDFDDMLDTAGPLPYEQLRGQVLHRMGLSDRESSEPREPRPDVSWAREAMGL